MRRYDLAIIGSGPGGYVAALYASRHGLRACVIEEDLTGGTCLNRGCIPTKSLINSASILSTIRNSGTYGVVTDGARADLGKMMARKEEVVLRLRTGIETLFRANKIDLIKGRGVLSGPDTIDVEGGQAVQAVNIILATGSKNAGLPVLPVDEADILSSDGILRIGSIPRSIAVAGGGAVGCEFACLFRALGAEVTLIEAMDRLLPAQSREASKKLESVFRKNGIAVFTGAKVDSVTRGEGLTLRLSNGTDVAAEKALVSVGRVAVTESLGLEKAGIAVKNGRIAVDDCLKAAETVYAIGDCAPGPQLAHKASYDAMVACDNIRGARRRVDYSAVPRCVWTEPEAASIGLVEEEAKARHPDAKIAKFPYLASGKAYLEGRTEGFVKIAGTPEGEILGVEIVGAAACDLIGEAAVAKAAGMKVQDWSRVVHGHPTISEILQEAAHVFSGTPIHSI